MLSSTLKVAAAAFLIVGLAACQSRSVEDVAGATPVAASAEERVDAKLIFIESNEFVWDVPGIAVALGEDSGGGIFDGRSESYIPDSISERLWEPGIFNEEAEIDVVIRIEDMRLANVLSVGEILVGTTQGQAEATYILKRADGLELLRESIKTEASATFQDAMGAQQRKVAAQRNAAWLNLYEFRRRLLANAPAINAKLAAN